MLDKRKRRLEAFVILTVIALPVIAISIWSAITAEERLMVAKATEEIEKAIASDPVECWSESDPLYYFRPKSYEGKINSKTLSVSSSGSSLNGSKGTVTFRVEKRNYFSGGPSNVMRDKVKVIMGKTDDGQWKIVDMENRP